MLGLQLGTPGADDLARLSDTVPTHDQVGSTLTSSAPVGMGRRQVSAPLGDTQRTFDTACSALRAWTPQRSLGATVAPDGVTPSLGAVVLLGLGIGPARLVVPNRVIAVVDEPDRYGYAYVSLPGHPACGEELFLVERHDDGEVVLTIRTDSRPAHPLRHLGFAIRTTQYFAMRRYISATARQVRRATASA